MMHTSMVPTVLYNVKLVTRFYFALRQYVFTNTALEPT
jgi:hypothetical protein